MTEAGRTRVTSRDAARWLGVSVDDAEAELEAARVRLAAWLRVCDVVEEGESVGVATEEVRAALCAQLPFEEVVPNFSREDAARVVTRCPKELRVLLAHRESSL